MERGATAVVPGRHDALIALLNGVLNAPEGTYLTMYAEAIPDLDGALAAIREWCQWSRHAKSRCQPIATDRTHVYDDGSTVRTMSVRHGGTALVDIVWPIKTAVDGQVCPRCYGERTVDDGDSYSREPDRVLCPCCKGSGVYRAPVMKPTTISAL